MAARKRTEAEGVEIDDALALRLGLKKN
jgi:hypothetical protein